MSTAVMGRVTALGRSELTLLLRSKSSLFTALLAPVLLTVGLRSTMSGLDLAGTGLSVGTVLVPGSIGFVLIFAMYTNLTAVYVARREELVLKRLRTGEASDVEILAANALPAAVISLVQSVLLLAGGAVLLELEAPRRVDLLVLGLLLGLVMMAVLAAACSAYTRTTEAAQLTPLPLMMVSMGGSGMFLPLETLPERVEQFCRLLPMTPVIDLVRGGWTGALSGAEAGQAVLVALVWIGLGGYAVRRWFRWDPRQ